tara:strand:+ start:134 stop:604 length:471 start_codon:yes stop_codon:yes gene_type:complete
MKKGTTGLVKYDSVEQRQDVLEVMRKSKYQHRYYGKKVSLDALDHSISIEPVQEFFTYNENNEVIEKDIMLESMIEQLNDALCRLSERDRIVLEMCFGLGEYKNPQNAGGFHKGKRLDGMTLDQIGEELDLTRERVRTIKENAIKRARWTMTSPCS